ncbi:hypothetical protein ABFS82_02G075100 [Erythranthe guttata]|uniref:Uncharacterized protein n=1 Tax=Erythranthe guttata TaxID=4155 RepID=A0A022QEV9_ERYGU|nr:PREDICTED: uncharacterized protein LOC105969911 [Erythranthe guttata]EYU26461.1 hypothetical protein MIMGU_mgv1a013762mg [Erythranthe guttata]|eukprot:XP_012850137.1 PREDICTED: uncharacterized protein LOC105969911 [Erythranthe guttata]
MRDIQTPQSDQFSANRPTKSKISSDLSTDPFKVMKKSLNPAFKAVSEDDSTVLDFLKELPEVSVNNQFPESAENLAAAYPVGGTHSRKPVAISDLNSSPMSSEITSDTKLEINSDYKLASYEVEAVIKHLKEARIRVMESTDLGSSKKLLKAMIENFIEEFDGGRCEDTKWLASNKGNLVLLIVMMVISAVLVLWFFSSGTEGFVSGPLPT